MLEEEYYAMIKPLKSEKVYFKINRGENPPLHILYTREDKIIVARCLDFSIASHGDTLDEARQSLSEMLIDHIDFYIKNGSIQNIIDPAEQEFWDMYYSLEMKQELKVNREQFKSLSAEKYKKLINLSPSQVFSYG